MKNKCIEFLIKNGWKEDTEKDSGYRTFFNEKYLSIDISDTEIVILSDIGDICHLPVNYYALLGYLIDKSQIGMNYL